MKNRQEVVVSVYVCVCVCVCVGWQKDGYWTGISAKSSR